MGLIAFAVIGLLAGWLFKTVFVDRPYSLWSSGALGVAAASLGGVLGSASRPAADLFSLEEPTVVVWAVLAAFLVLALVGVSPLFTGRAATAERG